MDNINGFDVPAYEEKGFLKKVVAFAARIGEAGIEKAYLAYHVMRDPETPAWAKAKLGAALAYLVMPIDLIPDMTPIGFSDDMTAIALALLSVTAHVHARHHQLAKDSVNGLFGRRPAIS